MKNCKCKESYEVIGGHGTIYVSFSKDRWYRYYIKSHEETNIDIYYVNYDDIDFPNEGFPFSEYKFKIYFDDTREIREEKLTKLLN